jgi:hypothetical protein
MSQGDLVVVDVARCVGDPSPVADELVGYRH